MLQIKTVGDITSWINPNSSTVISAGFVKKTHQKLPEVFFVVKEVKNSCVSTTASSTSNEAVLVAFLISLIICRTITCFQIAKTYGFSQEVSKYQVIPLLVEKQISVSIGLKVASQGQSFCWKTRSGSFTFRVCLQSHGFNFEQTQKVSASR